MKANTLTPEIVRDYFDFLRYGAYCTPPGRTMCALQNARTLDEWRKAQRARLVRIKAVAEEENYFDVYGKPETDKECKEIERQLEQWGCHCIISEVNFGDRTRDDWRPVDSVGMCVYANPLSPFDNSHVIDLMRTALDKIPQPGDAD